jgi:hypothetical protein
LYFSGSDNFLAFENEDGNSSYLAKLRNQANNFFISGSNDDKFPLQTSGSTRYVSSFFNFIVQGNDYADPANIITEFASYTASEAGDYKIKTTFDFSLTLPYLPPQSQSWELQIWKTGSSGETLLFSEEKTFVAGDPINSTLTFTSYFNGVFTFTLSDAINSAPITVRSAQAYKYNSPSCGDLGDGGSYQTTDAVFSPGSQAAVGTGWVVSCDNGYFIKNNALYIVTPLYTGWVYDGQSIQVTATTFLAISIDSACLACS